MGVRYSPLEMLDRLVSFQTVSNRSNLDLVDWVKEYLNGFGIESHLDFDETGTKASLFALVGPETSGGAVLSGHTDVVPVEGQRFTSDPWKLTERNGRLFGRGTCDMKGFVAAALAHVPDMLEADLNRPVLLALSRDEEIGCVGAPPMIAKMRQVFPPASAVIVGEPTNMKVVTAHKGGSGLSVQVNGHEVHSSILHKGVSAIMIAARLIEWANERNREGAAGKSKFLSEEFDPPWTTLHVGTIGGGTAQNITAKLCRFGLEFRCVPGDSPKDWHERFSDLIKQVESEMKSVSPDAGIDIEPWYDVPPLAPESDGQAEQLARRITGDNGSHVVSYGTEAGQFQEQGYSTVVCGPGDIAQAHQPDEFVTVEQFQAGCRFVSSVISELSS